MKLLYFKGQDNEVVSAVKRPYGQLLLAQNKATRSSLLGFLLDGFPVYGPEENGKEVVNEMLDGYHGHKTATVDFPMAFTITTSQVPILTSTAVAFMEHRAALAGSFWRRCKA